MTRAAKLSSATGRTRRDRRILVSILIVGVFLSGCMTRAATPAAAQFTFEQYEVVTEVAKRQTVLTGFLLGGTIAELAMASIDENGDRRLHI